MNHLLNIGTWLFDDRFDDKGKALRASVRRAFPSAQSRSSRTGVQRA